MSLTFCAARAAALLSLLFAAGLAGCGQKAELYREAPVQGQSAQTAQSTLALTQTTSGQAR